MAPIRRGDRFASGIFRQHLGWPAFDLSNGHRYAPLTVQVTQVRGETIYWRVVVERGGGTYALGASGWTERARIPLAARVEAAGR